MSTIPSRFINELPKENLIENLDQGLNLYNEYLEDNTHYNNKKVSLKFKKYQNTLKSNQLKFGNKEIEKKASTNFNNGERIFHQKFGMGNIINVNGENLEISFDKAGIKKIKSNFVLKK